MHRNVILTFKYYLIYVKGYIYLCVINIDQKNCSVALFKQNKIFNITQWFSHRFADNFTGTSVMLSFLGLSFKYIGTIQNLIADECLTFCIWGIYLHNYNNNYCNIILLRCIVVFSLFEMYISYCEHNELNSLIESIIQTSVNYI